MSASEATGRPWRHWEDLVPGETTRSRPLTMTEEAMTAFARAHDPQYFHADAEAAQGSAFGGLIASGIHTAAVWRQLDHEENGAIAWVCGVQWDEVRWRRAVRPGDRLVATSELLDKRPSASRPGIGLAVLFHTLENQDGEVVFSFRSTALVHRRPAA